MVFDSSLDVLELSSVLEKAEATGKVPLEFIMIAFLSSLHFSAIVEPFAARKLLERWKMLMCLSRPNEERESPCVIMKCPFSFE